MAGELNPAWAGGHGGAEETAGILAVDPDLVDTEHLSDGQELHSDYGDEFTVPGFHALRFQGATIQAARPVTRYSSNGWVGPDAPPEATKEWGEAMLDAMADYLAELIPAVKRL
jgi:creatinine amidohydrolase